MRAGREAALQLQEAVLATRRQAQQVHDAALAEARRERDAALLATEQRSAAATKDASGLTRQLDKTKEALEEAEDSNYDLQRQLQRMRRAGAAAMLQQRLQQARAVAAFCNFRKELRAATDAKMHEATDKLQVRLERVEKQLARADTKVELHDNKQRQVRDVLNNYKRNELMQAKVESALLQEDLKRLGQQRQETERQQQELGKDVAAVQAQIREIEAQMQDLSKVSAIQDGKINVQHAKRKRRLDQDFEHLLERAQQRKEQLEQIQNKVHSLEEQALRKEGALKDLEQTLVGILVEQQKKLIALLHTDQAPPPPPQQQQQQQQVDAPPPTKDNTSDVKKPDMMIKKQV